jgi:hypothetical protein
MKGPGYRHDLDVRRVWRCPACQRERKVPGDVTQVRCGCQSAGQWMELVGERTVPPRPPAMVSLPEQSVESFHLTEEELATPVQGRIRRRSFSRFAPEGGPDAGPPGGNAGPPDQKPEPPRQRPRPEKRPKLEKRPLSELDHFGEPRLPKAETPPEESRAAPPSTPNDEGFGAGLDDSASQ